MSLTRVRHVIQLLRPTWRAMAWSPLIVAGLLAVAYVRLQAPDRYIDHVILVLRLAGLLICIGAAFIFDDSTEETIGHVPTPLVLRRLMRAALVLPLAGLLWLISSAVAGPIPDRYGGPLPMAALSLEAAGLFVVTLAASSLGARVAPDRAGGIIAAPILLGVVAVSLLLPDDRRLLVGSPLDPVWDKAHDTWVLVLVIGVAAFLFFNRDPGCYPIRPRLRAGRGEARSGEFSRGRPG